MRSARYEPRGCPYYHANQGLDLFVHLLCVSVPSTFPLKSGGPVNEVRLTMMLLNDDEIGLSGGRFTRYRRGLEYRDCPHRIALQIQPGVPSNISRSMQRAAWFDERITWCGEEIRQGWSMFTPARYEDADCRFEFCFEDEKEAVLFGLRWKGEP